jgi:hypothetical protein
MSIVRKRFVAGFAAFACAALLLNIAPAVWSFHEGSGDLPMYLGFPCTFLTGGGFQIDTGRGSNFQFSRLALAFDALCALVVALLGGYACTRFGRK